MFKSIIQKLTILSVVVLMLASCKKDKSLSPTTPSNYAARVAALHQRPSVAPTNNVHVFATGLQNPRGLKFGPDGNLYVAEGGPGGGTSTTEADCMQVPFPVGPYTGQRTGGRITMITPSGTKWVVTDRLPTSAANEIIGGDVEGVADVAFVGNTLYALLAGAGCSHGVPSMPNSVVKIDKDGTPHMVANLSAFQQTHPVAQPEPDDFEPDGTWYSMLNVRGDLYVIEPNHGELDKVTTSGDISRVVDISASQGHIVPTVMAYHGNFFVGNLHPFPNPGGASKIMKINPAGQLKDWATNLNMVLGIVIDNTDRMYVLENTVGAPFPTPGLGRILRIDPGGNRTTIADGLNLPTGMTMGPDGKLYVSATGFGPDANGGGQVVQIDVN